MAVWQVDFYVVPRRALAAAPRPLTPPVLNDTSWWASAGFPVDYGARLAAVAPAVPSRTPELETWGPEEGNRVEVWSHGGRVRSMMVHVDVRRLDSKFGAALILFVRAADAVLVRRDGLVIEPTINAYAGALRNSAAWRYASDPAAFLAAQAESSEDAE
jgi:hypothetical protein